eukprot:m.27229 g.27229  ORF g.27229 m.27229 type:complete len:63 (+) comp11754_c0_seq30:1264-1452(+)
MMKHDKHTQHRVLKQRNKHHGTNATSTMVATQQALWYQRNKHYGITSVNCLMAFLPSYSNIP